MENTQERIERRLLEVQEAVDPQPDVNPYTMRVIAIVMAEELARLGERIKLQAEPCECWSSHVCDRCTQLDAVAD